MEVVLLQQLGAAERQHVRVHVPAGQLRPQVVGPLLRLLDGPRRPDRDDFAVLADLEPAQQQPLVHPRPDRLELRRRPEPHRRHDLHD